MSFVVLRTYLKSKLTSNSNGRLVSVKKVFTRKISDEQRGSFSDFTNSTIIVENRLNLQELPVIIRKTKDLSKLENKPANQLSTVHDSISYNLIQDEFKQCDHLREVFSLLSKCTKITPIIALGAMERIYDLEKINKDLDNLNSKIFSPNVAKGAILDKLLHVVVQSEDPQTILNALNSAPTLLDPYRLKFCDEIITRVLDGKLTVEQLCQFIHYLANNDDGTSFKTIDKLWVGFFQKEDYINEKNIVDIFQVMPYMKISKKIVFALLEEKLSEVWNKITVYEMIQILDIFIQDKYISVQFFNVVSCWLFNSIHAVDEDSLLDVVTKLTYLNYNDEQVERAIEKFLKFKGDKVQSPVVLVGILNYCLKFQVNNESILNHCAKYFTSRAAYIPKNLLKSFLYPYGFLHFNPKNPEFWIFAQKIVLENFDKISVSDMCAIVLSFLYLGKYPSQLIEAIFCPAYLSQAMKETSDAKMLYLIDTALSLEFEDYLGPMLPKDHWSKSYAQDVRIQKLIKKINNVFVQIAGDVNKISFDVLIPNLCSDKTYLIDVMIHPVGLGSDTFNWKVKSERNENIAVLIHLPDHYCSDNEKLIGPQQMKKRHLKILGMKVVSVKYSVISKFYTSFNMPGLREYLMERVNDAEPCF